MKPLIFSLLLITPLLAQKEMLQSPDGSLKVTINSNSKELKYEVHKGNELLISPSRLGFILKGLPALDGPFEILEAKPSTIDETWQPVWGQHSSIRNHANELALFLRETEHPYRRLNLTFRAYNDGVAFRYEFPKQPDLNEFEITDELTAFNFTANHQTWWVEALPDTYERDYNETNLTDCAERGASTPVTMLTTAGTYLSLHEANLTDWSGMKLKQSDGGKEFSLKADLVPWFESDVKVKAKTPHFSPWRTIQIGNRPGDLIESSLILNLNEPCAIEDPSWIEPAKFMGIWWGCITGTWNWELAANPDKHGATTERALRYIDACVRNNIPCLLIEGWNEGWEGDIPGWGDMNMMKCYPDFDIQKVTDYGREKGVTLVGHHETGGNLTNYEKQLPAAFEYYNKYGINRIKTGYVSGDIPLYTPGLTDAGREHHHGQFSVRHHQKVIEMAAEHEMMISAHEPIKATGISRTWPNFVAREGARGGEFNHFIGNPPSQTCTLPFTRLLGGPMDYTPALFDGAYHPEHRFGTRAQQLGLMVVIHSPLVMAADFYQAYDNEPATQFIRNIPVGKWDETRVLASEIGDYVITARRKGENWFLGGINNEDTRQLKVSLDFLTAGKNYHAIIYQDAPDSDYRANPYAIAISEELVTADGNLDLNLAAGGGVAIEFYPEGTAFTRPSGEPGKIAEGQPYKLRAKHSGRLLTTRGTDVQQYADYSNREQSWIFHKLENGHYRLTSGTRALAVISNDNPAVNMQEIDATNLHQQWIPKHIVGTWFHLENASNGKLLDVAEINYSDGAGIHTWEHAHSPNQVWSLEFLKK
ncbi:glycoside hydrolase family 97 catalytic domain-containing protein [Roseibacillus persicicus]|uniref:glycoside hydrolase family 97 catalytic domain-containing protein n=1 Tax=Roseibacillus persicicus TaxID=454148 RepID=UPI00398B56BE